MKRTIFAVLVVLGGAVGSGSALAAKEPFQECQLAHVKAGALFDKLYWKLYGGACKQQEIDPAQIAAAQSKMDKAVAKYAEKINDIGAMNCDPDFNYASDAVPNNYNLSDTNIDQALVYCNGEVDII